jgi:hypothetical protein
MENVECRKHTRPETTDHRPQTTDHNKTKLKAESGRGFDGTTFRVQGLLDGNPG